MIQNSEEAPLLCVKIGQAPFSLYPGDAHFFCFNWRVKLKYSYGK